MKLKAKIFISSDHGGYEMKKELIRRFKQEKIELIDLGTFSSESVDYPDYAKLLCNKVLTNKDSLGIAICGTGIGMSIACNKFRGIRCALINNVDYAKLSKQHNNANIIALSGRFSSIDENYLYIKNFLESTFEQRHQPRLDKINDIETNLFNKPNCDTKLIVTIIQKEKNRYIGDLLDYFDEYFSNIEKIYIDINHFFSSPINSHIVLIDIDHYNINPLLIQNSRKKNYNSFFIYLTENMDQNLIDDIYRKEFDYIIDQSKLSPLNSCILLKNLLLNHLNFRNDNNILFLNDFIINKIERKVWLDNNLIDFSKKEYELFMLLTEHENQIVNVDYIFKRLWSVNSSDTTRVVSQYVYKIKNKLDSKYIKAVRSRGYIFNSKNDFNNFEE